MLQAAGALQPDYYVFEWADYDFVSDDGSVFTVHPSGWFSRAKRTFVAGPLKGQTEALSKEQVSEYRKKAEEKWGRYIRGTIFSQPGFIPGTERKFLPLFEIYYGVPYEAGRIDETGVHWHTPSNVARS